MPGAPALPDAVVSAFGLGRVGAVSWVARGSMGEVFRAECGDGGRVAVKRQFWDESEIARIHDEIAFADTCRRAGVDSPRALLAGDGSPVVTDPETGDRWRVYEWIDGSVQPNDDVATGEWLAEQIAMIHRLGLPAVADHYVEGWYCRVDDDWDEVLAAIEGVGDAWAARFRERVGEFRELARLADSTPLGPLVMCHRDALGGNVLLGSDGRRWLIDWENHGAMEPWREAGVLLMAFVERPDAVARMAARFRGSGGCALPRGVELFASGLAIWLNYLQGRAVEAADESLDAGHRDFAIGRVTRLVSAIPTLEVLDRAASAARAAYP